MESAEWSRAEQGGGCDYFWRIKRHSNVWSVRCRTMARRRRVEKLEEGERVWRI